MFGSGIKQARDRLLSEMEKLDPTSEEYSKLNSELEKLTRSELNQYGWKGQLGCGVAQTLISAVSSTVKVWSILKNEAKGNITPKAVNYAPKPAEHNQGTLRYPSDNGGKKK